MPINIHHKERLSFPSSHKFLDKLPGKIALIAFTLGVKLGIIRRYGTIKIVVHDSKKGDKTYRGYNISPNVAIKHIGDILIGDEATNIELSYMEPDTGNTEPALGDTDTETPPSTANRLAITAASRNTSSPFEIILETFIPSTEYTRPFTIRKLAVFWGPDETGDLFAIGKLASPATVTSAQTATITYAYVFR